MIWFPTKRATLLIPTNTNQYHLYVLLTEPHKYNNQEEAHIIVNISTLRTNSDPTCILDKGDHEFIKHKSFVAYRKAVIFPSDKLKRYIDEGFFITKQVMKTDVFKRIEKGLVDSHSTPKNILDFYIDYCEKS